MLNMSRSDYSILLLPCPIRKEVMHYMWAEEDLNLHPVARTSS